ncbi:MAG TPA: hypothetical protein VEZ89_05450 [Rubrivivax sp.]|nr:hypothetical protein [Rubrivivax sp.]
MKFSLAVRPAERRRRLDIEGPAWADTVPAWFRSEAFAEDLIEVPSGAATPTRPRGRCMKRPQEHVVAPRVATAR